MKNILFYCFAALSLGVSAQDFDEARMDSYFNLLEKNQKAMGSFSLFQDGKEVYSRSIGFADVENEIRADKSTKYRIGSISKTFTAALVMQLVEEGKLGLGEKLSAYYPTVANAGEISIKQLLKHQSGLFNFTNGEDYPNWMESPKSKQELLEIIKTGGTVFEPGEKTEYSNSNYVLLTFIIEDIEGAAFQEVLQERIIKPLNLQDTYFGGDIIPSEKEALSFMKSSTWRLASETDMSVPLGAGALVSTPTDLNKFFMALFRGEVVTQASLDQMKEIENGLGIGLFRFPFHEKTAYGHTGGIDGFSAMSGYFPEEDFGISYTLNGYDISGNDISIAMLSIYFEKDYEFPEFTPVVEVAAVDLEPLTGIYGSESFPLKISVSREDTILMAQASGQSSFPLQAYAKNKFRYEMAKLTMEFLPEEDKMIFTQGGMTWELLREKR